MPAKNENENENETAEAPEAPEVQESATPRRFRVLHAAVGGVAPNKKGEIVDHDFYHGAVVTEAQLAGNAAHYFSVGAIAPLD